LIFKDRQKKRVLGLSEKLILGLIAMCLFAVSIGIVWHEQGWPTAVAVVLFGWALNLDNKLKK